LVPVFGVLGGWLLLNESIGITMVLGFSMIVFGVREVQRQSEQVSGM